MISRMPLTLLALPMVWGAGAKAQNSLKLITGTVTETANLELIVFKKVNNKSEMLAEYNITPDNPDYAFAIPQDKDASYRLLINVMKQGNRSLEFDKMLTFPLQLPARKALRINITPSLLDTVKKSGLEISAQSPRTNPTRVSGSLVNAKVGGPVRLERVVNGKMELVATFGTTVANSRFELVVPVKEEGFYYLTTLRWRARIYLKPSEELEVTADAVTGLYSVVKGSEENKLMEKWQNLSLPITSYGYNINVYQNGINLDQYISDYQKLQPSIAEFKRANDISNQRFNKLFDLAVDMDNVFAPVFLLSRATARKPNSIEIAPRNSSEPPAFFRQFTGEGKFNDAAMLEIGEAMHFLQLYGKLNLAFMPDRKNLSSGERLKIWMDAISNDSIKSAFFKDQMAALEVNNLSEFRETFQPFEKYATTPEARKKYQELYEHFIGDTAWLGKSSYNFSLPDTKGRVVTMSDFKGKVVFIDVWATWCGPCKEQFPFLKEIEEEYKDNKGIVFVGISIDRAKDKEKWLQFIQKYNLPGIQLFDDAGHGFGRKYGVLSIPRFMLIDRDGNWIEIRLPRPSDKEDLKRYLDKALGS